MNIGHVFRNSNCKRVVGKRAGLVELEGYLRGRDTKPWQLSYFKLYKSQLAVIKCVLKREVAMLGPDNSTDYCPGMISADSLVGANLWDGSLRALVREFGQIVPVRNFFPKKFHALQEAHLA